MANLTIKERREQLTEKIRKARAHFLATETMVRREVKKKQPNLEWWQQAAEVEKDPRVRVAHATLLALCEAANIMGAEID